MRQEKCPLIVESNNPEFESAFGVTLISKVKKKTKSEKIRKTEKEK